VTPWPGGISAITLFVDDIERAAGFYSRAFGLPVHFRDAESVVFGFADTLVNLLAVSSAPELVAPAAIGSRRDGARFQLTLSVDDVDATCALLRERGVTLLNGPVDRPWGVRTASFQDPDGHVWEIAH
jgi:catechol 2,3-dioxygenase-like lactoylglutathione lyase family enzyme